ncbi:hypothetical protein PMAYCL1PPCAC_29275 [Pristionchus mayeri]|uniref:C2H2-type domain-containing protein n=1 Tax=Pristionchus mayeri TaxID=1317129 RepID=A0AAN5DBE8_9BILA|nr:hypothetical protein PMAYCL1PPCAC_29275 [Pristionchus mayeri]
MVLVHQRPSTLIMAGPARMVPIKRETLGARQVPAPQRTRWQCAICGKLLSSKRSYDEHLNIHNQARPFSCEHCDYAAASQMTLRRHILRNHTSRDDWHYKCPYCGETYMEPASYQQHVSSRHFGRSATFGCPFTVCSFQTKCSKHFREHFIKHHSCTSSRRNGRQDESDAGDERIQHNSSSRAISISPSSLTDENLQHYLVDDDLGVGFGRRISAITRPIIRSNGEIEILNELPTQRAASVGSSSEELCSKTKSMKQISSSVVTLPPLNHPPKIMVLLRKNERIDQEIHTMPSTSPPFPPSRFPPPRKELHPLSATDDDFMKAPIILRPSVPLPLATSRMGGRRVQMGRRLPPPPPPMRRVKMESCLNLAHPSPPSSPITLGGSRHAPAMIPADGDVWMIGHEEEVNESDRNVHVYDNGSIDFECD